MDLTTAITSLSSTQMSQIGQTLSDELAVQTLGGGSSDALSPSVSLAGLTGSAATPAATVDLSPAAQALLDGQVSGMQISQLEHAEGIEADPQASNTADTTNPADPFGTGPQIDDGYTNADGTDDSSLAALLGEVDPTTTSATAPDPTSYDTTPFDGYSDPTPDTTTTDTTY